MPAENSSDGGTVTGQAHGERLTTHHRWTVVVVVALTWFILYGGRLVLPALSVQIQGSLGIDNGQFGIAVTMLWATYSVMQFPSGVMGDDIGYRPVLVAAALVMGVGFAALAGVRTFIGFVFVSGAIGVGTGMLTTPTLSLVSELFGEQKGRALGVVNAAGDASGVVGPLAATAILVVATWHITFLALAIAGVGIAVAFHAVLGGPYTYQQPAILPTVRQSGRELLRSGVPVVLLMYSVYAFAWQGLSAFIPLYAVQAKGLPQSEGNAILSLFFLAGVVIKPAAGWLSDITSRRLIASGSMILSGATLVGVATVADTRLAVFVLFGAFGTFLMVFPPVMQAYLMDLFAGEQMGGAFGLSRTVYILIGSVGPAVIGAGSELFTFDAVFVTIGAGLLLSGGVLFVTMRFIGGG